MARRGENIRKRADGRWEARYIISHENEKPIYKSVYGHGYLEVKRKRQTLLKSQPISADIADEMSLNDLSERWLNHVKFTLKESSYTRYVRNIRTYILPYFKNVAVQSISIQKINDFKLYLFHGENSAHLGLSAKTISDIISVLKLCLIYGENYGIPCPDFSKVISLKQNKHQKEILSIQERNKIEGVLWHNKNDVSLGILLSLYTGIRIGELCALKWSSVDLGNGILYISQTLERISDLDPSSKQKTKIIIHSAKTDSSIRAIPIPGSLIQYLMYYSRNPNHYVLTNSETPTEPHTFYMRYKKFMEKHDIHGITFHALRHTFATNCVELGFDTKALSEILGHSNVTTTLKCYIHPTMQSKRAQMELLEKEFICGQLI